MQLEQPWPPGTGASLPRWMGLIQGAVLQPFPWLFLEGSSVCLYLGRVAYRLLADLAGECPEPGGTWH